MDIFKGIRKKVFIGIIVVAVILIGKSDIISNLRRSILGLKSENIYVYNMTDNKKELSINGNERISPASLTKIMTTLVALENVDNLSNIAPVNGTYYEEMISKNASMTGFYSGENTSYRDLLYGTMLASGGECANSLAVNISGDIDNFIKLMNEKSKSIGLSNTRFNNVEGLDNKKNYSTAKDIGDLINYSLNDGDFKAIFTRENFISSPTLEHPNGLSINSTVLSNLVNYQQNNFEIIGGKSGTTENAGFCWATYVEKDGKEYICVVMNAPTEEARILDTLKIMEEI